jgi:putative radical SAM enzyme (TIGR03279 family)
MKKLFEKGESGSSSDKDQGRAGELTRKLAEARQRKDLREPPSPQSSEKHQILESPINIYHPEDTEKSLDKLGDDFRRKFNAIPLRLKQNFAEETFLSIDEISIEKAKREFRERVEILDFFHQYKQFKATLQDSIKKDSYFDSARFDEIKRELPAYRDEMLTLYTKFPRSLKDESLFEAKELLDRLISMKDGFDKYLFEHQYWFTFLTDYTEYNWQRLAKRGVKRLDVAVHTTNPELRSKMVDGSRAGEIIDAIERLDKENIRCRARIMLCPAFNDGQYLDKSIRELAKLRPTVEAIVVEPLWPSKLNRMLKIDNVPQMRNYTQDEANLIVDQVEEHQREFATSGDSPFVYLPDSWYLLADREFPPAEHYGTYSLKEDFGVGMTRPLLDEWERERERLPSSMPEERGMTMVTSVMAEPVTKRFVRDICKIEHLNVQLKPVKRGDITVAGLLGGQDVLAELEKTLKENSTLGNMVLVPSTMLEKGCNHFYHDKMTIDDFKAKLKELEAAHPSALPHAHVEFVLDAKEMVNAIRLLAGMAPATDLKDACGEK